MVTALYRRYRPETFADLIGQSQVTEPLMTALRTNRVNHAYLFSGPRGCGKTTSARILARCLNCAEGPTDTPCGVCPSCVELARDGGGSLDVVEIDAASHNGVDDARDIRERAIFAPARDRYKIFILDEAHMVTPQGFNALLKIVEEPPEHVKFIFATTEPEKVIGTIRSRTHHYPFRLVPPGPMLEYVQQMCDTEKMQVAPGVLPLVVRAGGGSPRDTLSLLDQLMAGSDGASIEYERAVALLGYTSAALLDETVDSIGVRNAASAFDAVDRVIQTGQDPRRFVEDLLERMRDLIIVAATSAAGAAAVLRGVPQDELDRMATQAAQFGPAELSRTADILNAALTEMSGATSPRLHLELMIARALIPATDDSTRGALARVERLERRVGVAGDVLEASAGGVPGGAGFAAPGTAGTAGAAAPAAARSGAPTSANPRMESARPVMAAEPAASVAAPRVHPVGPVSLQQLRDAWPEVLEVVRAAKVSAWLVVYNARVLELRDGEVLVLSFPNEADLTSFKQRSAPGQGISDFLRAALLEVLGLAVKFVARADGGPGDGSGGSGGGPAAPSRPGSTGPGSTVPVADAPATDAAAAAPGSGPVPWGSATTVAPAPVRAAPAGAGAVTVPQLVAEDESAGVRPDTTRAVAAGLAALTDTDVFADTSVAPNAVVVPDTTADANANASDQVVGTSPEVTRLPEVAATPEETPIPEVMTPPEATRTAPTSPVAPAATSIGWATVAIPGSGEDAALPALPFTAAPATRAAATSPSRAAQGEEPPPFSDDDAPPDFDSPPDEPYAATPYVPRAPAAAGQNPPQQKEAVAPVGATAGGMPAQASVAGGTPGSNNPNRPQPTQNRAGTRPAFAEKQRYGEAVIREILGATFLEEMAHDSSQRPRGA